MAYIGAKPVNGFFEKQDLTTDGSTTTFTLQTTVGSTSAILVSVGGVIQEPEVAYNLGGGGTTIIFTEAPASTADTYVHYLGQAIVQNLNDVNGTEFILDVDADTSLTADTDDEIDIKVGGADRSTIKTTGFHNLDNIKFVAGTGDDLQIYHDGTDSLIANSTGTLKIATETSGIAITLGHSTSEVTVADNMTVAGDLTVTGTASFGDTNITNVGSITLDSILNDGTDGVTIDSSTDVVIDAGGADIILKDDGTEFGRFTNSSTDFVVKSAVSDKDLLLKGNDGGSEITALTLDMSAAGKATFNNEVVSGAVITSGAGLVIADDGNIGSASDTDAIAISSGGVVTFSQAPVFPDGSINVADIDLDGATDIGAAVVDADLFLIDDGAGGTMRKATASRVKTYMGADTGAFTVLNLDIDGATDIGADLADADLLIVDDGAGGTNRKTAMSRVKTYVSDLTLTTAAQTNITSLGTLTALTVDDVAINGKVITMTGSTDDTAVLTVATNGALTLETTDTAAAAANIQITADGTFEVDATTITLDSAGDIVFDAAGNDFNFKAGGTEVLRITNSSSDVVIKPTVDTKDIIFQQFDGTEVARIEDNATFNVVADKLAINGTAITATAAELNYVDGVTSAIQTQLDTKASTGKAIAMAIVFG